MKTHSRLAAHQTALAAALVFVTGMSVPASVRADDTEVFFPSQQTSLQPVNPNIMFIIDTSGSMAGTDGDAQTRLQRVQTAFGQILGSMGSNVNVGLMRYNALLGGPISFPVAPIDAYVDTVDTNGAGDRTVQQAIADANSEAVQAANGGAVTVAPQVVSLNKSNSTVGVRFDNVQIPRGVTITGAQITFYGASGISTTDMPVGISAEQTGNAAVYAAEANNITGRTYTGTPTPPSVSWTLTAQSAGNDFNTPELKDLINDIVGRTDWCGGNALALKFTTSTTSTSLNMAVIGSRNTTSDPSTNDPISALAPILTLSFSPADPQLETGCNKAKFASQIGASTNDDSTETADASKSNQPACKVLYLNATPSSPVSGCGGKNKATTVGLRFPNLNIPRGATILGAAIDFTPYATDSSTPTLTIRAENAAAPVSYSATGANTLGNRIVSPGLVSGGVNWPTTAWSSASRVYSTPDLTTLVQAVINRSDWNSTGNALSFFITPNSGSGLHAAYASDGSLAYAPRLRVQIEGAAGRLTVRQYLQQVVNGFVAKGGTPTMGVLYEAARYFRGEAAFYGRTRSFGNTYAAGTSVRYPGSTGSNIQIDGTTDYAQSSRISHRASFDYSKGTPTRVTPANCSDFNLNSAKCDGESWTGTTIYKSPITDGCQSNNIILLSDGLPNVTTSKSPTAPQSSAVDLITSLPGWTGTCAIPKDSTGTVQTEWQCGNELAGYLFTKDQSPVFGGVQNIRTYTIAFSPSVAAGGSDAAGAEFLGNMANNGGGRAFSANTVSEVTSAFNSIIGNILSINTTFVAPAVTVNAFNRLANRNDLYFAVFRPDTNALWSGNLKRYQLSQTAADGQPQLYDSSTPQLPAVDAATGYFKDGTKSFWSPSADGPDIAKGGAASQLTTTRKIYTYVGASPSNVDLSAAANALHESNSAITSAMLGLPATATATDRTALMQWARGIDVLDQNNNGSTADARQMLGDPLHSEPVLINYGGTDASPDTGIFMGTNVDGLHAFSSRDGSEYFNFMPKEMLANLNAFYTDSGTYLTRPNGLDGPITSWVNDGGKGAIGDGDFAYIYAGMRRGGNNYYALNVTNRAAPKLMFQITGGNGSYAELGQTWSRAIHAKIRIGGANKDVLIFSAGYDPAEDGRSNSPLAPDAQGRALFVADATTGARLWWAGIDSSADHPDLILSDMNYSIPASPTLVDLDGDGLVDRIYLADTGGQVFRIVLGKDGSGTPSLSHAKGSRIAILSGSTVPTARRFYNSPDVALITENVSKPFLALSLGSGLHEHPLLQANQDRLYILRDPDVANDNPGTFFVNGDTDLYDATANHAGSTSATVRAQALADIAAKKGLYVTLGGGSLTGEKVMSKATTFNNEVLFTSFQPGVSTSVCSAVQGLSRLYRISVTDATPTQPLSGTTMGALTAADRSKPLKQGGLPPNPTILFPSISSTQAADGSKQICIGSSCLPDQTMVCVGAECFKLDDIQTTKTFWRQN